MKNLKGQMSPHILVPCFLAMVLLLNACSPEAFPDCCGGPNDDRRDAPFSTTYLFQYKTGTTDIIESNPQSLLRIISEPDILTLINAASTEQLNKNGLIGGLLQGFEGPVREAAFQVTDRQGNRVSQSQGEGRNLFYNSLGGVPEFLISLLIQEREMKALLHFLMPRRASSFLKSQRAQEAMVASLPSPVRFLWAVWTSCPSFRIKSAYWVW